MANLQYIKNPKDLISILKLNRSVIMDILNRDIINFNNDRQKCLNNIVKCLHDDNNLYSSILMDNKCENIWAQIQKQIKMLNHMVVKEFLKIRGV